ncbi:hypothetical protein Tco_1440900, partial [Tanacetum coccineum]
PLHVRATIEDITDEPGSFAAIEHRSEKILLLTWHDSSAPTKESVCDFVTPSDINSKEAKDRVYMHSIESKRNLKLYKNDNIRISARCDGKVLVFTMSQELQVSMSKAFKAKAEREIKGDHILQYSMLRDYVVELQSTKPNTTVKIVVERDTDPSLPTRAFQRIYVCLEALNLGFKACRRELLGLNGAFMKGPFPGQVLEAVGLDSNNEIYPLAYALVEAESKSSW